MRRSFVILATVLGLVAAACGSDSVSTGGELLPSPAPAPTLAGEIVELEVPEVQAEVVLIGVTADETVAVHALPGLEQPLAGSVRPGTSIEPLGQAFETEDGLLWWQVRAGAIQGWIQPNVAYRGAAEDITDRTIAALDPNAVYDSPEAAAQAVADVFRVEYGASDVIIVPATDAQNPTRSTLTVDLLGLDDDSQIGYRLIVASASATGWTPQSVFQAPLCAKGIAPTGRCL